MTNRKQKQIGQMIDGKFGHSNDWYEVSIGSHHYGEYRIFDNIQSRVAYDGYEIGNVLEDMGIKDREAQDKYLGAVYKTRKDRGEVFPAWDRQAWGSDIELYSTMITVEGNQATFDKWIESLGELILSEAYNDIGGDDSYFDYFPDLVDIFAQACYAFDKRDYMKNVIGSSGMRKAYSGKLDPHYTWKSFLDGANSYWDTEDK